MKLAIVIPWFGRELRGGAEQHAWQIAARLAQRGHAVDVLTTCCRSHQDDWATNHLPAGVEREPEGFAIHRFPVETRDRAAFERVAHYLVSLSPSTLQRGVSPISAEDSEVFTHELIKSTGLTSYVRAHQGDYDWFILLPYLYGPVLEAARIVGERAALQPCLHNEAYAYLPQVAAAFRSAGKILFISEGEQELALQLFGPGIWPRAILAGAGVESRRLPANNHGAAPSGSHFVLYLGRKDAGKNVPMLLRAFRRFRAVRPNTNLRFVLAGNGTVETEDGSGIEDLGLVNDETKEQLLRDCRALFQPSENESFSRVLMEAWMHRKPVAAAAACLATAVAVQRSGGGWLAANENEWAQRFVDVARLSTVELDQLGAKGQAYAQRFADWDEVIARYEAALAPRTAAAGANGKIRGEINQFLPNLSYGDAISNQAIWIRNSLRALGLTSEIYARYIDPPMAAECRVFSRDALQASGAVIYHHSVGSEITPHLLDYAGPKCLIYHNITPADFFRPYRPEFADILERGRDDLGALAGHFEISLGDSEFNSAELAERGFPRPSVLPIAVDPAKWNFAPDAETMARLQDGRTNILFVGRIAPNKKQDDLLLGFAEYLAFDPDARLILAGKPEDADPYSHLLEDLIVQRGLQDHVEMPGIIHDTQLAAYYRTAHLFWSMSEHEGFCVPLVEAMWFDIPVFAYRSSAVPETLGDGGLLFTRKDDLTALAGAAYQLHIDEKLRRSIIKHQRRQRETFLPFRIQQTLEALAPALVAPSSTRLESYVETGPHK
ncbi:MAG: glycosyltransferase [Chthoniobacterales bacterium]